MSRHFRSLCALVLGLTLLSAVPPCRAAGRSAPQGKDFLWKVSSSGATGYLLGSVHVLDSTAYRSDPAFEAAFRKARIVVFETDLDRLTSPKVRQLLLTRGSYPKGESLRQSLPKGVFARVEKAAGDLGLPPQALDRFRPWFCALTLADLKLMRLGFEPAKGVDRYFYEKARSEGKKTVGLETPAEQLELFAGLSPKAQEKFLLQTLDDLKTARSQIDAVVAAWEAGDGGKVQSLLLKGLRDDPVLYRRLLVQRNRRWMRRLEKLLAGRKDFLVVVGAAHLVGPDGLVSLLRARGFEVKQQ